jgi:translation initiation factor 3 subunit J
MSDDWEKQNDVITPPIVKGDKWEGEDEDDDVKDNWDDEEEEDKQISSEKQEISVKQTALSAKKKKLLKFAEKDRKDKDESESKPRTAEEILADKLERQRLQEESDLLLAKDAFGDTKTTSSGLDISLTSREDFDAFKKSLVEKLLTYDKSVHYVNFLENLFRELCVSLESDDIKRLSSSLTALFNEKVKAQKAGTKSKKKGKGFSVRVERNDDFNVNNDIEEFDDFL